MVYSDVIKNNEHVILKKKEKYTLTDLKKLLRMGYNLKHARFIVLCTCAFYDSHTSKVLKGDYTDLNLYMMFH